MNVDALFEDCKPAGFITVYEPVAGWKAVQYRWNPEGFWEPWATGTTAHFDIDDAIDEGVEWATELGIPFMHLQTQTQH